MLTADQLLDFEDLVESLIREIQAEIVAADTEAVAPDNAIGRLSRMDSIHHQEMAKAAVLRKQQRLVALQEARHRLEKGTEISTMFSDSEGSCESSKSSLHRSGLNVVVANGIYVMCETPREVFARVFGDIPGSESLATIPQRHRRSILDSVLDQYLHFAGPHSPLGSASKSRLSDHLDRIREFEQRVFIHQNPARLPTTPPDSKLPHGGRADPGGEGIDIRLDDLVEEWHLLADLYAFAIQTDRVRFGSINFLAAGEIAERH